MDINRRLTELEPELIALRRDFHRHPELGFKEFRTQTGLGLKEAKDWVEAYMREHNIHTW